RCYLFFFNDTATTEIYTLSLHDALPIFHVAGGHARAIVEDDGPGIGEDDRRSEEHTSELQSHLNLVCRLMLDKKDSEQLMRADVYHMATVRTTRGLEERTRFCQEAGVAFFYQAREAGGVLHFCPTGRPAD